MEEYDTSPLLYDDPMFPMHIISGGGSIQPYGWHKDLEIKLIRSNKLYITIDSQLLVGNQNEIFFINPYQIHAVPSINGVDQQYELIMIDLNFFSLIGVHSLSLEKIFLEDHICFNNHLDNPLLYEILLTFETGKFLLPSPVALRYRPFVI